jgi:glycogen(starch) synthase
MSRYPSVSVIVNTDGRAAILGNTIESLRYLRYPNLELVVVPGPTADGTRELLKSWQGEIKVGSCPTRNVAQSRNIGVAIASGEIIAFLDDDEVPEPEWLEDLVPILEDPAVAVASGWLHDHTGKGYQTRFDTVDRLGNADHSWARATPEFNFPLSFNIPHAMINSAFRRDALIDVGGFDEEFEYYLDETDLMIRFVDRGWRVVQTDRGFVHHKFLSSAIRNEQRVMTSWYAIIKSKTYFALVNGARFVAMDQILADIGKFVDGQRIDVHKWIKEGVLAAEAGRRFEQEADQAVRDGVARALSGRRRLGDRRRLAGDPAGFVPFFPRLPPPRQHCFVFLSSEYSSSLVNGDGYHAPHLARAVAAQGHQVHVLTRGTGHDRIDFEDGMWVHRLVLREALVSATDLSSGLLLPPDVWNYSMTMLREAEEIAKRRPILAVHAPLANAQAIAFVQDRKWPLVTSLPAALCRESGNASQRQAEAAPHCAAERRLLLASSGLIAPDRAVISAFEAKHGLTLGRDRDVIVSHEVADWSGLPADLARFTAEGRAAREAAFVIRIADKRAAAVRDDQPLTDNPHP